MANGRTVRGSNSGGDEIFRTSPDRPWGPPSLLYNGYRVFFGGKERPERDADPSPPSSSVGHERVELYLYSPYGPYGLYRTSVPVQGRPLPLAFTVINVSCQQQIKYYIVKVFTVERNVSNELKIHSLPDIFSCELFALCSCGGRSLSLRP
jgi:hypothetical protein